MKVFITDPAKKALKNICEYYSSVGAHSYVENLRTEFIQKAHSLSKNYQRGQVENLLSSLNQGHRYIILIKHFKIIYLIEESRIIITDFFDTRQDPDSLIDRHQTF
ncbi:type II toxin-antitoxin system RelE/ParE family toxin [Reichenbachiella ulvae]|uniref:Type II toxin-antitoxin system RelE/ParE family toxin n=1 Tax=Reichenbachiella ulvae TaxID=2980104 RepID=A0ABT3CX01_9BACT|nr:type II toxin-antitoxin system RelE/ParE family toxin [Reichenbachiella ulvae]MCV9387733.1 type II toxin-antitoxin system RelE/ParE family toxin [Reichenbachiella ulvae]